MKRKLSAENLTDPITAHMSERIVTLAAGRTVEVALADLRAQHLPEAIVYFYVVDAEERLAGVVPTRRLLMARPEQRIDEIMVPRVVAIPAEATVKIACEFFIQHKFLAFPVVDADRRVLGVADVGLFTDEVLDVAEKRQRDDVFQLVGVHLARSKASPLASFKDRFPWLLCNIGGGTACAILSGFYEPLLQAQIVLALFVPVVLALAESVSMQSMTITVHALHGSASIKWKALLENLWSEFLAAILLGVASGASVGGIAWLWKGTPAPALAIGGSIALAMITACMLGVLLPTAVRALRGDPRIAAGPIVLASADLCTLLFYFNVAGLILTR